MLTQPKNVLSSNRHLCREKGLALLGVVFLLGMATTAYVLYSLNASELKIEREKITIQALSEAKAALIAWAVANPSQPGMLPYPDRGDDPDGYDGKSDCYTTTLDGNYDKLLGRLPWQSADNGNCTNSAFISGMGSELKDGSGTPLWYAVSRNLVYPYIDNTFPVINPGMINSPNTATAPYQRNGGTTAYPWLTVYDKKGQLVSNRVAAIIIAPGSAIGAQNRSAVAPNAAQYLDTFTLTAGGGAKSNRTYAFPDEDFYMGEDAQNISSADNTYVKPYEFNDKLVYITIDELMVAVEKRAAAEAKSALNKYKAANGYFPYASQLGTSTNFSCELTSTVGTTGLSNGFLPVHDQTCSFSRTDTDADGTIDKTTLSCSQNIFSNTTSSGITQVRFTRSGGANFSANTGSCTRTTTRCTCTGSGTCSNPPNSLLVSCNANSCTATGAGFDGTYRITGGKFTYRSGGCTQSTFPSKNNSCTNSNSVISCVASDGVLSSCGDATFSPYLPTWFTTNNWQSYIYYQIPAVHISATRTSGSTTLTTTGSFNGVSAGWSVTGTGIPTGTTVSSVTNATTLVLSTAASTTGTGSVSFSLSLMTVGTTTRTEALLISVSNPINGATGNPAISAPFASKGSAQTHPSCNQINNYMDSTENTDIDSSFDKVSSPRSYSYNDQSLIVAP